MKSEPLNCVRCNALNNFGPKTRTLEDGRVEEYISCKKCRWELILVTYDDIDILNRERKLARAKRRKQKRGI